MEYTLDGYVASRNAMIAATRIKGPIGMGRWGWRIFEGDQDLDLACEQNTDDIKLSPMIHQTDRAAPPDCLEYYKTAAYIPELKAIVDKCRAKLDTGIGSDLMKKYREREDVVDGPYSGKYRVIIVGALLIRAGAKISQDDLDHLRKLATEMKSQTYHTE